MIKRLVLALSCLLAFSSGLWALDNAAFVSSPTITVCQALFNESADKLFDVTEIGAVIDPTFLLKLKADTDGESSPYEIAFASNFGKLYLGAYMGADGCVTDFVTTDSDSATDYVYDGAGHIVQTTNTTTCTYGYAQYSRLNPIFITGLSLGAMKLGIYNSFWKTGTDYFGRYAPSSLAYGNEQNGVGTNSVTQVLDAAGGLISESATRYGNGYYLESQMGDNLVVGLSLPLAGMAVKARLGAGLNVAANEAEARLSSSTRTSGLGLSAYTPDYVYAGEPKALSSLSYYSYSEQGLLSPTTTISASLGLGASLPFEWDGNAVNFDFGINYDPRFYLKDGSITDQSGATIKLGEGNYLLSSQHTVDTTDADHGFDDLTVFTYYGYRYSSYSSHSVDLPLSLRFEPSPSFRFAVGLDPSYSHSSYSRDYVGSSTRILTHDDGDGVDAATDPDDSSVTRVITYQPFTNTYSHDYLGYSCQAAMQFYLKPNKFRVNIGVGASGGVLYRNSYLYKATGLGSVVESQTVSGVTNVTSTSYFSDGCDSDLDGTPDIEEFSKTSYEYGSNVSLDYNVGFTYFHDQYLSFDFIMNNDSALNLLDTSNSGGFFDLTNYTIQITIKMPPKAKPAPKVIEQPKAEEVVTQEPDPTLSTDPKATTDPKTTTDPKAVTDPKTNSTGKTTGKGGK